MSAPIVAEVAPCPVRQVFYQASVRSIVEKSEAGYGKVQRALVAMRRVGVIRYRDIVDNTRWMRKPRTFDSLQDALDGIAAQDRPSHIYHLGDFDPSGVNAGEKIEQTLRELAPEAELRFARLAVNEAQIEAWHLPSRPTKMTDSRARKFGHAESVELDAIHPDNLRELVEQAILAHVDEHELGIIKAAEESERAILRTFAREQEGAAL